MAKMSGPLAVIKQLMSNPELPGPGEERLYCERCLTLIFQELSLQVEPGKIAGYAENLLFWFGTTKNVLSFLDKTNGWQQFLVGKSEASLLNLPAPLERDKRDFFQHLAKEAFLGKQTLSEKLFLLMMSRAEVFSDLQISKRPGETLLLARKACAAEFFTDGEAHWELAERFYLAGFREKGTLNKYLRALEKRVDAAICLDTKTSMDGYTIQTLAKDDPRLPLLGKTIGNCEHLESNYAPFIYAAIATPCAGYCVMTDQKNAIIAYAHYSFNPASQSLTFGEVHPIKNFNSRRLSPSPAVFLRKMWTTHVNKIKEAHPCLNLFALQQEGDIKRELGFYRDEALKTSIKRSVIVYRPEGSQGLFDQIQEIFSVAPVLSQCPEERPSENVQHQFTYSPGCMGF